MTSAKRVKKIFNKTPQLKRAMAARVLQGMTLLPFNQGYLKALVDFGLIDNLTFDDFMQILTKGDK